MNSKPKKQTANTKHADNEASTILEREKQALHLRKAGASYRAIGEQLGVSHEQIRRDIDSALTHIRDEVGVDAKALRDLEVARLDDYLIKLQPKITLGSEKAIDTALRIGQRRSHLLGLDAPVKTDVTTGGEPLAVTLKWHNEPTTNYPPELTPETGTDRS